MVSARLTAPCSINSSGRLPLLQRVGARHVPADVTLVEDLPARHGLVGVHRLADLDVGVRLVAEPPAGPVDVDGARALPPRAERRGAPGSAMKTMGSHQASSSRSVLRAESHRRLQHFTGVAGVRDRPLRLVGLVAAVAAAHVRVAAETARGEQNALARLDVERGAVAGDARADDAAVLDDEVVHRGVRPHRRLTVAEVDQHLQHLTDERRTVGQDVAAPEPGELVRRNTRIATANARGERLKYCTERSSLVLTTNP